MPPPPREPILSWPPLPAVRTTRPLKGPGYLSNRKSHAHDPLVNTRGDHLRHGPGRHAVGCHGLLDGGRHVGERGGDVRLHSRGGDGAQGECQPADAVGHLYSGGHDGLHHGYADDHNPGEPGHAHDPVADAFGDHLRHGTGQHPVGRHCLLDGWRNVGERGGDVRLHAERRGGAGRR